MNNPNPFVPKGSLLEQQSVRRSRLKIMVTCVLGVSVSALLVVLFEGCKREAPTDQTSTPPTDMSTPSSSTTTESSNPPPPDMLAPSNSAPMMAAATSNSLPSTPPPIPVAQVTPPSQPPVEPAAGSTYEIVSGDTLGKIAKAHGVTVKAIEAANPGVDPKKLKIKQKLTIPPPTQSASTEPTSAMPGSTGTTGGETYVVKSGDNLGKIAKKHGVSLKALKSANNLTTDHIKVGDKLTIPAKTEAVPAATATDTSAPAMVPAPAPAPAPATPGH
ncbi:MAG TPA: LysM peptidoglycan-binding domain-containing protein [Verrucomicrobiae bacterium]|jgi:LysM repeat protein|nr:LysM peptidoglycan-binding domain-containing protein [Verrucomicrobiae bacterium]